MKVFLDTNVVLDVIAKRESFVHEAICIWALAETRRIEGCISALSFATIYYIVRKVQSRSQADSAIKILRDIFAPVACDAAVLNRAIEAGMDDFEDAIQYFSALSAGVDCLITRNTNHFPDSQLPILTPKEFLATYSFK